MEILKLIGRTAPLFVNDISSRRHELADLVSNNRFLVIGGAGSIGQAVNRYGIYTIPGKSNSEL